MKKYLEYLGKDKYGHIYYFLDISKDSFIHFTTSLRASQIIQNKKLLLDSPYQKFGPYGVFAVSLIYGSHIPGVSLDHVEKWSKKEGSDVVAIEFKTNTIPKHVGTIDEVSWGEQNVDLINPKIISKEEADSKINQAPDKIDDPEMVVYDKNLIPRLELIDNKKLAYQVIYRYFNL